MAVQSTPEQTTRIYFVRHGQAANNAEARFGGWSALPLTPLGAAQARACAAALRTRLPTLPNVRLIASDLVRALTTAEIIGAALQLPVLASPQWRERTVGAFDGMLFADAARVAPDAYAALRARHDGTLPEGAESLTVFHARIAAALTALVTAHVGQTVIVVTHGIAIHHALCAITGAPSPPATAHFHSLVENASISSCSYHHDRATARWRLHTWNDEAHLTDLEPDAPHGPM